MLSYKESLKILKETNALLEGHFVLSSGLHSDKYVQCAQLLSKPSKAKEICLSLAEKINENFKSFDLIVSPAMGGVVIGYEIGKLLKTADGIHDEKIDDESVEEDETIVSANEESEAHGKMPEEAGLKVEGVVSLSEDTLKKVIKRVIQERKKYIKNMMTVKMFLEKRC